MKTIDIVDAINARLTEKWPARTVYLDVCPVDFDRPSFWLQVTKDDRSDASRYTDRLAVQIALQPTMKRMSITSPRGSGSAALWTNV